MSQYDWCSSNTACAYFHIDGVADHGICGFEDIPCSELTSCESKNNRCYEFEHICVHHPRCHNLPVCYPVSMISQQICPPVTTPNVTITTAMPISTITIAKDTNQEFACFIPVPLRTSATFIPSNATWIQNGISVARGNGRGTEINQFAYPLGIYVDDVQTVYVADQYNDRIVEWKYGATSGKVVAGGNEGGNETHQLNKPYDVIVDKVRDSLIICDHGNRRVVRWPRQNGKYGETIISNISCFGLTMDQNGFLYVVDTEQHGVRRYETGDNEGTIVAGGNGKGNYLDQLSNPSHVFVDQYHSVYVSDYSNLRVTKWEEGAKQGILAAGSQDEGSTLMQVFYPEGVVVDQSGTVYVSDRMFNRIIRWQKGATEGSIVAGGNGEEKQANKFDEPMGLSFDRQGNLYASDWRNHRVQKFNIV
ncbi:unnamed protein product [Rotaria sordida]|uniref:Uncharacterized protein n=1 Tax=Rotaria sordida TaxID=392033 RepID=A0A815ZHG7_9BILA|nr:unnamed protein product [Rotaria sordida]CAF1582853.1 unnamed protein product [Rotaria sordida]